ncbi:MAG TPA: hypothetical protein VH988_33340, partial [Thermoanaerobaculia bacterium]|nr:hypothetical protein [Thermoanaerobaculia bacterium]
MFGSSVLEVAIGVVFVYLLLSLIVTAATELISGFLKWRSNSLWEGIRKLLDADGAETWVKALYDHPLVNGMAQPDKFTGSPKGKGPSYIPSRTFAVALLEVIKESGSAGEVGLNALRAAVDSAPDSASVTDLKKKLQDEISKLDGTAANGAVAAMKSKALDLLDTVPNDVPLATAKAQVRAWLAKILAQWPLLVIEHLPEKDQKLKRTLTSLVNESHQDVEKLKTNIETWFNNSMQRVSGWYKRKTQAVHILLAVLVTLVINVDSVLVVNALSQNQALRDSVVSEAQAFAKQGQQPAGQPIADIERLQGKLSMLDLPVGWVKPGQHTYDPENPNYRNWPGIRLYKRTSSQLAEEWWNTSRFHLLGWLLTAFAISLGAPFWFDMLNKVINI